MTARPSLGESTEKKARRLPLSDVAGGRLTVFQTLHSIVVSSACPSLRFAPPCGLRFAG